MPNVKTCVLRTAGTNCDKETAFAFEQAGAAVEVVHINRFLRRQKSFDEYHILALPGGFSYGDDIASGKIFANELRFELAEGLKKFIADGKLIIGICNGFQILVKSGILPGAQGWLRQTSLIINDSGKFEDRWVYLKKAGRSKEATRCVWTAGLPQSIYLPVAHGEGKFIVGDAEVARQLKDNGQIVLQYCDQQGGLTGYPFNPNGSLDNIAGICDPSGRIFGLMPHPERHVSAFQHPRWTLQGSTPGDGLIIFKNGVDYARAHCA